MASGGRVLPADTITGTAWAPDVYLPVASSSAAVSGQRVVKVVGGGTIAYPDLTVPGDGEFVIGVTLGAVQPGGMASIRTEGQMIEGYWSFQYGPVFCGPYGQLTQTMPLAGRWVRQVGFSPEPTVLIVQLRSPTLL